jgi:hypothetical protein
MWLNPSQSSTPALTGSFGDREGPFISDFVISDPDDGDRVFSAGDVIDVFFSEPTNSPIVANVTDLLLFSHAIGAAFHHVFLNSSLLRIYIDDPAGHNVSVGVLTATVRSDVVQVRDVMNRSYPSVSQSLVVHGSVGRFPPQIVSFSVSDPDDSDSCLSANDLFVIVFDTRMPDLNVSRKVNVDALLQFSSPLFYSIALDYSGRWEHSSTSSLFITVTVANYSAGMSSVSLQVPQDSDSYCIPAAVFLDALMVHGTSLLLTDDLGLLLPSSNWSSPLTGDFGSRPAPLVMSVTASDVYNADSSYGRNDRVEIVFSEPTNQPDPVHNNLTSLSWSLGRNVSAFWESPIVLVYQILEPFDVPVDLDTLNVTVFQPFIRSADSLSMSVGGMYSVTGSWGSFVDPQSVRIGNEFLHDFRESVHRMNWWQTGLVGMAGTVLAGALVVEAVVLVTGRKRSKKTRKARVQRISDDNDVRERAEESEEEELSDTDDNSSLLDPAPSLVTSSAELPFQLPDRHRYSCLDSNRLDSRLAEALNSYDVDIFANQIQRLDNHGHYIMFGEPVVLYENPLAGGDLFVETVLYNRGTNKVPLREFVMERSAFSFKRNFYERFLSRLQSERPGGSS